ncbi:ATP-binding protein [Nonomuraea sp. NPDC050547]|uniref:ATP-binding protein n=1 Tax=Nonomuraea sp. NPDC050547 TaxID=3364368 RepID=UPI00379F5DDD
MLQSWKKRSGRSYQALGRRLELSHSTVHRFCTGKQLPQDAAQVERLAAALGADRQEAEILRGVWRLAREAPPARPDAAPPPSPSPSPDELPHDDLPRDIADFTGRAEELGALLKAGGTPSGVWTVDGMAGVGKTTLVLHAAHQLKEGYPDGRIFLDLHGHTAGVAPMPASDALKALLSAAGVPEEGIPAEAGRRASLWRSALARRRMLIVLDNAVDAEQVMPLLPGATPSLMMITSRARLVDLDGTGTITLGELSAEDALAMFMKIADAGPPADLGDAEETVRLCGYLPLAIRIVTARLRHRLSWTPGHLNEKLRQEHRRLAELQAGSRSVIAAFSTSYGKLGGPARRMFRLLGLIPGVDVGLAGAAALTGQPVEAAEPLLEQLIQAHLLQRPSADRYRFHDLVRDYARAVLAEQEQQEHRQAALGRIVEHYLRIADHAAELIEPSRRPNPLTGPVAAPALRLADRREAICWLERELPNLIAAIESAAAGGLLVHTWQLARSLWHFFLLRGDTRDWIHTHRLALSAVQLLGDREGEAETLKNLGVAYWLSDDREGAIALHHQALVLDCWNGDPVGQAKTLTHLGYIHHRAGEYAVAADHFLLSVMLYREVDDPVGGNRGLSGLGDSLRRMGRAERAMPYLLEALSLSRSAADPWGEIQARTAVALAHLEAGEAGLACRHLVRALELSRLLGDRLSESTVRTALGATWLEVGDAGMARRHFTRALTLSRQSGDRWGQTEASAGLKAARTRQG